MALSTYVELQASVNSWLNRTDLTAQVPDFIALAESSIGTDVRLRDQVTVSTLSTVVDQDYVTLPADWLEFKFVKYSGDPLELIPADRLRAMNRESGEFLYYSIEGDRLLLSPTPASVETIDIAYYARIPALSVTPTNFLLTKHPQIYLCKALAWAYTFIADAAKVQQWESMYQAAVAAANGSDKAALISGSPLTIRPR